ncbi:MAG: hypothetical protein K8R68_03685, partial [Bacteroidales bacterium]|nr:hypothetical protein [Bacteroidales bacterium]
MIKIITHTALRMLFIIILLNTAISFGHNIPINQTFTQDGQVYEFQTSDPIYSCKITGNISLNSEMSLIRVILVSETNEEFLIYEIFPSVFENSTLTDAYYETCYLDGIVPDQIKVQIVGASITINSVNIEDGYIENAVQLQETEKLNIENSRIELLNDYIVENELIWYAGMNPNVEMSYEEKRNLFEDGEVPNFQGLEYYVGGFYSNGTPSASNDTEGIRDNFDWRSRHGANNPSSTYFDGDDDNWSGWIPPRFQTQGQNDCYAQAPTYSIEALCNVYFNQHLDINLSQQDVISCLYEIPYDGLYYGNNWDNISTGFSNDLNSVYFISIDNGFAVGNGGIIIKTNNNGDNWILQNSTTSVDLNSIYFKSGNGFVAGNSGTILKTTNNGNDWIIQSSGTIEDLNTAYFININIGYVVGNTGTILKTSNGSNSWTIQSSGTNANLYSVFFTEANINTGYAVGSAGTILKTLNGGATWFPLSSGTNEDLFSIYFPDENNSNTGYVVGNSGIILMTSDGGANWFSQPSGISNSLSSVFFTSELFGYIVGDNGTILKTTNAGLSWNQLSSGTNNSLSCITFYSHDRFGYAVGDNGSFIRAADGGGTGKASYYITYNGIVNEECFPYQPSPNPPCSDKCPDPDELISADSYEWYYGSDADELTIKQDIIENGPLPAKIYTWSHAMMLLGYGTVEVGDEIFDPIGDEEIVVEPGSPFIGMNYWLFEQSWGSWNNATPFV